MTVRGDRDPLAATGKTVTMNSLNVPEGVKSAMPELDFMIVSDYVRAENGVLHMIAGGFDTITARTLPAVRSVGIGLSLKLTQREMAEHHTLRLVFHGADGARITEVGADLGAHSKAPDAPPERKVGVVTALNMSLPLPAYGDYRLELLVDGDSKKEIVIHVVPTVENRPAIENSAVKTRHYLTRF